MFNVRAFCLGKAHEEVIKTIVKHGTFLVTEDNEKTLELPEPFNIHVGDPFADYMVSPPHNMFGERAMQQYVHDLIEGTDNEFVYTYHDRLFDYPRRDDTGNPRGNGDGDGIDQVAYIIEKLRSDPPRPGGRRGITWYPEYDDVSDNPPLPPAYPVYGAGRCPQYACRVPVQRHALRTRCEHVCTGPSAETYR
ncbi:hypothetical protein [Methanogenium cariaci]|uniref:hypothetical protein n=1 Tax=Methanogenium cariaci TaxID=2197 RepID=UPI0007809E1B|nr:hypothetical protein [Methanogenium cariaci]